ncbi:MAG: branched-chain amino acid ABC transporter permease, partial [Deltaproteobacteria bacterium]|nr:branched-chain amino acid ABC transporter permease [Deltaproteobacteria bacterium]
MDAYIIQGMHGLVYGMLLFLVTSGLTLVFGMMGVLNIAHAAFYMVGAYFAYTLVAWTG